jgi:hypothetical protein
MLIRGDGGIINRNMLDVVTIIHAHIGGVGGDAFQISSLMIAKSSCGL